MKTVEFEIQKANLAREILSEMDEATIKKLLIWLKRHKSTRKNRHIGILEGRVYFREEGDGKITMEEFLGL